MSVVSVIIPTYNRASCIADAIESVLAQSCDSKIIVADDGSTDNTAEIVARFSTAVTYIPLPHRGQPAATRNSGLRVASGEFIAFLDSDDLFLPGKLKLQLAAFDAHPKAGLVYSNGIFFRDAPALPTGHVLDGLPAPSGNVFAELLLGNFLAPSTVLLRRVCLDTVGFFDERPDFFAVEDYDLWLRVAAQFPFAYVPGDVAAIRRHRESISHDVAALRKRDLLVLAKMDGLYPDLMRQFCNARHEAYARNHGAIAAAEMGQGHLASGLAHGLWALSHTLQMTGLGLGAFVAWRNRRRLRQGARS